MQIRRNSRGIILTDLLLTILIVSMLIPIAMICISVLPGSLQFNEEVQDEIALAQLRHILLCAYDMKIEATEIAFSYREKEMHLSLVNDHMILQPGTQIFLSDIDSTAFEMEENLIYVVYERENTVCRKVLVPKL